MHESGCHLLYPLAEEPVIGLWPAVQTFTFLCSFAATGGAMVRALPTRPGGAGGQSRFQLVGGASRSAIRHSRLVLCSAAVVGLGGWRVRKMRRLVERVLCGLPFEAAWFRRRGVRAEYIGHPYCDALHQQRYDETFLQQQRERGGTIVGLLPGSRRREVEHNFPSLYRTAQLLSLDRPELRFLVACYRQEHADWIQRYLQQHEHNAAVAVSSHGQTRGHAPTLCERLEVHVGRTAEIIQLSRVCAAVSGSVTLELLYHARPACVLYRIPAWTKCLAPILLRCRYVTLVNLLAERELFPEFVRVRCPAGAMAQTLENWLENAERWQECHQALLELRQRFFQPGACQRAASLMLQRLQAGYAAAA
jgi:lipid-A-disaccharide synthase